MARSGPCTNDRAILYHFSDQGDLVFDPMAGGGSMLVAPTGQAHHNYFMTFTENLFPN